MKNDNVVIDMELPLPLFYRGKVRDSYELDKYLLFIVSDRISAFDVVLPCGIPEKGHVLNQLSAPFKVSTSSAHFVPLQG